MSVSQLPVAARRGTVALLLATALVATAWTLPAAAALVLSIGIWAAWLVRAPARGLTIYSWLLPFHILTMAVLFGALGLPGSLVRIIAAWKEALLAALVVAVLVRALARRRPAVGVSWLDLAVAALGLLAFAYLVAASQWLRNDAPLLVRAYGFRDAVYFTLLYFVGRATSEIADDDRALKRLYLIVVITASIAVLERLFVPPEALVLLGAASYFQDFLGVAAFTQSNEFGLPTNYWTMIGGVLVRRAGSTSLSSQGFAIPFLIFMPAATLWLIGGERRRKLAYAGYAVLWIGLLLTITRATIVACGIQVFLIAALLRKWRLAGAIAAGGAAVLALTLAFLPGFADFVWHTLTWQTSSSLTHGDSWIRGLRVFLEHPFGVGLGMADQTAVRFGIEAVTGDNQYLKYATEMGILGLGLFLAVLIGLGAAGWRLARRPPPEPAQARLYGVLVVAATVGVALNGMTAVLTNSMQLTYLYFWFGGVAVTLSMRTRA